MTETRADTSVHDGAQHANAGRGVDLIPAAPGDVAPDAPALAIPPRAVFVVGMPRSGTTLLTRLLDGHPQLFTLPHETQATRWVGMRDPAGAFLGESAYGKFYPAGSEVRKRFEAELRAQLGERTDLRSILLAIVAAQLRMQQPKLPADAWVEKTPRHARDVPALIATFGPATKVIALVRDPRATLASRRKVFRRTSENHVRHLARRWATVDTLVKEYAARFPQQFLAVTYEALVHDPEAVMRRLATHVGIAWDASLVQPSYVGEEWQGNSSYTEPAKGVTTASLARWKDELSPEEIAQCEDLLRPRMAAWGYETTTPARRGPRLERALIEAGTAWYLRSYRRAWARAGAS